MAADKLSEHMQQTLTTLLEEGQLVRWPGGWWTIANCPVKSQQSSAFRQFKLDVPTWAVTVGTIMALVKRGYATLEGRDQYGFPTRAVPTAKAKDLI